MTSNTPKVSQTTTDVAELGRRDAFHVPGILVRSDRLIQPGDSVCFVNAELTAVELARQEDRQAIVDPFIPRAALPGTLFWVFVIPELVSGLVHHFSVTVKPVEIEVPATTLIYERDEPEDGDGECADCYGS